MPPELETDDDDGDGAGDGGEGSIIDEFDGGGDDDLAAEQSMEIGTADLGLDDGNDIIEGFDGVEDEEDEETESGQSDSTSSGGGGRGSGDPTIQGAITDGLAEAAAVGLEGSERERVRSEMHAVAEKFKVGYFGEQCAQKYLKRDIEDIPPEYGLAAALIAFGAIAIYKRPDGEERVRQAVNDLRARWREAGGEEAATRPQQYAHEAPPQPPTPQPAPQPERNSAQHSGAESSQDIAEIPEEMEAAPADDTETQEESDE